MSVHFKFSGKLGVKLELLSLLGRDLILVLLVKGPRALLLVHQGLSNKNSRLRLERLS